MLADKEQARETQNTSYITTTNNRSAKQTFPLYYSVIGITT